MDELELESTINIQRLGYEFLDKPVIVGGLAMEYYGLRKHGEDIDFIITERDYQRLKVKFPDHRKDVWGDFGFLVNGFELFRSIYKFDHGHYSQRAIELTNYKVVNIDMLFRSIYKFDHGHYSQRAIELTNFKVVNIDMLFRMKVFALGVAEKHDCDVELLKEYYKRFQNRKYQEYLDHHVDRYLASTTGILVGIHYDDEV